MKQHPTIGNYITLADFTEVVNARADYARASHLKPIPLHITQRSNEALNPVLRGLESFLRELKAQGLIHQCPNATGYQNELVDRWAYLAHQNADELVTQGAWKALSLSFKRMLLGYLNQVSTEYLDQLLTTEERFHEFILQIDQGNVEWYLTPFSEQCPITRQHVWISFESWVPVINVTHNEQNHPLKVQMPDDWVNPNSIRLSAPSTAYLPSVQQSYTDSELAKLISSLADATAPMLGPGDWSKALRPILDELASYDANTASNEHWVRSRIERRCAFSEEYPEMMGIRALDLGNTNPAKVMQNQVINSMIASALSTPLTTKQSMARQCFIARHAPEALLADNFTVHYAQALALAEATYPGLMRTITHLKALCGDDEHMQREMLLEWIKTPKGRQGPLDSVSNLSAY